MTHDLIIDNGSGAAVRSDINGALPAIATHFGSPSPPSPAYKHQIWVDEANGVIKQRNLINDAWIIVGVKVGNVYHPVGNTASLAVDDDSDNCMTTAWWRAQRSDCLIDAVTNDESQGNGNTVAVNTNLVTVTNVEDFNPIACETVTTGGAPTVLGFNLKLKGLYKFGYHVTAKVGGSATNTNDAVMHMEIDGFQYGNTMAGRDRNETHSQNIVYPISDRSQYRKTTSGTEFLRLVSTLTTGGGTPRTLQIATMTFWCECVRIEEAP